MPERLMGTDCKFVGNMSTLVQIQLGPKIRQSTMRLYNPLLFRNTWYRGIKKNPIFGYIPYFPGIVVQLVRAPPCQGGSCGFEPRQSRRIQSMNTSIQLPLFYESWYRGHTQLSFPKGIFFFFPISHQT